MRHLLNNVAVFASVDGAPRIRGYVWKREMMKAFPQAGKLNPNTNILFECGGIRDLCKGEWMKAFQQAGNLNRGIMCSCVLPCMISGEEESPDSAMTLIVLSRSSNTSPKAPTTQQSRADHSLIVFFVSGFYLRDFLLYFLVVASVEVFVSSNE